MTVYQSCKKWQARQACLRNLLKNNTLQTCDSLLLPLRNPHLSEAACGTKKHFLQLWAMIQAFWCVGACFIALSSNSLDSDASWVLKTWANSGMVELCTTISWTSRFWKSWSSSPFEKPLVHCWPHLWHSTTAVSLILKSVQFSSISFVGHNCKSVVECIKSVFTLI